MKWAEKRYDLIYSAEILRDLSSGAPMLIELYGQNFGCFRDEFRLSLLPTDIDPDSDRGLIEVAVKGESVPLRLLRAIALYGPNGSGKSTVLRAASALGHLLGESFSFPSDAPLRPYEPFALGPKSNQYVKLGIKAVIAEEVLDYCIEFNREAFIRESLVRLGADNETLIDRKDQHATGSWSNDPQFQLLSKSFRRNALLLSLADNLVPGLAKGIAVGFQRLLTSWNATPVLAWFSERSERVAERAREDANFSGWLRAQLRAADVGVVDFGVEEVKRTVRVRRPPHTRPREEQEGDKEVRTSYRLELLHAGSDGVVPLPYSRESLGTQRLVEMSPLLYDLTHNLRGSAAFVDEFDASMHPLLLQGVVRHFNCEIPTQGSRGQLVFATHETSLLDEEAKDAILRRDQVYFTEKDALGAARLFSLAEVKERNNLNVRRRYLQGRYGALPSVGTFED